MVPMKTFDDRWQALKQEDTTLPAPEPHSMMDAEDMRIVQWGPEGKTQKITWRERMAPYSAWIQRGDHKGVWRSIENRLVDEIVTDCAVNHFGERYRVNRSTPYDQYGEAYVNAKIIEIQQYGQIHEILLILDGLRVLIGQPFKIRNGQGWKFKHSVPIEHLLNKL